MSLYNLKSIDQKYFYFVAYYALIYMAVSAYNAYINVYYLSLGFSVSDIGILLAIGPIISIATQPIWGFISDKTGMARVLFITIFGSAILSLLFPLRVSFLYICLISALYTCLYSPVVPISDTCAIHYVNQKGYKFSLIRMSGTIGYSIVVIIIGRLVKERISDIFLYNTLMLVALGLVSLTLPKPKNKLGAKTRGQIKELFANKAILLLFIHSFVFSLTIYMYNSFIGIYIKEFSDSNSIIGISLSVCALSEIPILLTVDRFIRKHDPMKILLLSGFVLGLRFLLLALAPNLGMVFLSQIMGGSMFILNYYCSILIMDRYTPDGLKATGQNLIAVVKTGIAGVLGAACGGYIAKLTSLRTLFCLSALVLSLVTALVFLCYLKFSSPAKPIKK